MRRAVWGVAVPLACTAAFVAVALRGRAGDSGPTGAAVGVSLAMVQSAVSTAVLRLCWRRPFFMAVWAAGILARFLFFGVAAFVIVSRTTLNVGATLGAFVAAGVVFSIVEWWAFLQQ